MEETRFHRRTALRLTSNGRTSTDVLKSLSPGCSMFPLRKKYLKNKEQTNRVGSLCPEEHVLLGSPVRTSAEPALPSDGSLLRGSVP